ncbi:MAG: matrixin family metalloprotease [Limosilactobacillus mucosae]
MFFSNSTGSFTFKETKDRRQANITVKQYDLNATNAAGVTNTSFNPLTGHLLSARVRLNVYYLQNPYFAYGYQRILYTAEHELGHAIGLQHVNRESVMYPVGSYFGIEQGDVNSVNSLYDGENN